MSKPQPPSATRNPGDEAEPDAPQTGEMTCPVCHGSGKAEGQNMCENCGGSGVIIVTVGDA